MYTPSNIYFFETTKSLVYQGLLTTKTLNDQIQGSSGVIPTTSLHNYVSSGSFMYGSKPDNRNRNVLN